MVRKYKKASMQPIKLSSKPTIWQATFMGEAGRATTVAEVNGRLYQKGVPARINQAMKERLEAIINLQFEFKEV